MKTAFKSNYGNFDYTLAVELPEETLAAETLKLIEEGMANIGYRFAGSAVDKMFKVEPKSKGGEGRRGVEYSEANAKVLKPFVQKLLDEDKDLKDIGIVFDVVGQHVFGENGESAMSTASNFVDALLAKDAGQRLKDLLVDLYNEDEDEVEAADRDALVVMCHKHGLGQRKTKNGKKVVAEPQAS